MSRLFGSAHRLPRSNLQKKLQDLNPDNIHVNTYDRPVENARKAFLNTIAPQDDFSQGSYSEAFENGKEDELKKFHGKLQDTNYDVYDFKKINTDLWQKGINENNYVDNASKSGILVTDGKRKITVKNYNSNYYNYPKGGINAGEDPKKAALREFKEETTLDIDPLLQSKMEEKCLDWRYTLKLDTREYNELISKFTPHEFITNATPEVSGIKLEDGEIVSRDTTTYIYKKYLKYKTKYLKLKNLIN
jgi:8-oxo-dGTP pyrophosphatase MutT (NUDIX family)